MRTWNKDKPKPKDTELLVCVLEGSSEDLKGVIGTLDSYVRLGMSKANKEGLFKCTVEYSWEWEGDTHDG